MDKSYMNRALYLAKKGWGKTNPNPLVGAVIVKEGVIIGEGAHEKLGGNHAEINALRQAAEGAKGADIYVTLEPCSHFGRTPPCANALIEAGISRVFVAMKDPNPKVSGSGIQSLLDAGIQVEVGLLQEEEKKQNEIFIKYITKQMPFVILKAAMSFDGKIATAQGDSKWITGEKSRRFVHKLRKRVAAIMVGVNTVKADNPYLTVRLSGEKGMDPIRIITDSRGEIPLDSNVLHVKSNAKTILATTDQMPAQKEKMLLDLGTIVIRTPQKNGKVDLNYLMKALYQMEIDSVLLEGGSILNASAIEEGIIDKAMFFIAPKMIGGLGAPGPVGGKGIDAIEQAIRLQDIKVHRFDQDIMMEGYFSGR